MPRRITNLLTTVAAIFLFAAPASQAKLKVVASISDLGWLAQRVGGDAVDVSVLCPGNRDPHYLPAKPSLTRKLRKADLLIYNGLELEIGWLPLLINTARNPRIESGGGGELDCSLALTHILEIPSGPVSRAEGDIHPLGNPHYLIDPRNGAAVATLMAERMATLDPKSGGDYRARAAALVKEIEGKLPVWEDLARPARNHSIVVYAKQWEYLTEWLGLTAICAIEHRPGIAPSPKHVEELIQKGKHLGNSIVIAAPWNHLDAARNTADRMGAPFLILPPAVGSTEEAAGYFDMFDDICSKLGTAAASDSARAKESGIMP
ncbi:MAG: metal ABC transporter substrate-binding protein [Candidatus Eisenbacteria bacterium]|uniref:Metal ABC transporter substrate-binding protein n=1 Tax=Eiseniibacteriota bacterium TaxID=2212470 RepID=A0A948RXJ5_UNCEI|nr:metal ABC transporter substrate-binding protein [Candidatus Eisenbacteria bacterium]